jgi:hypothetical protein
MSTPSEHMQPSEVAITDHLQSLLGGSNLLTPPTFIRSSPPDHL